AAPSLCPAPAPPASCTLSLHDALPISLQELENLAPSTWYVNVLAVLPNYRGKGLGTQLLLLADETGRKLGKKGMSVIVSDANIRSEEHTSELQSREKLVCPPLLEKTKS